MALLHVACGAHEGPASERADRCVPDLLWGRPSEVMTGMLDTVTLPDLADQAQRLGPE